MFEANKKMSKWPTRYDLQNHNIYSKVVIDTDK